MNSSLVKSKTLKIKDSNINMSLRLNEKYVSILEEFHTYLINRGEFMRAKAFKNGAEAIMNYDKNIKSTDDIKHLKGIGKSIINSLNEFNKTGKIEQLEKLRRSRSLSLSVNIISISPDSCFPRLKLPTISNDEFLFFTLLKILSNIFLYSSISLLGILLLISS